MGFWSSVAKAADRAIAKSRRDRLKAIALAQRADNSNIDIVFQHLRIIIDSISIVRNTRNYATKVMRYKLIEEHLICFNNTENNPYFSKTATWGPFVANYYNGLNEIIRLDEEYKELVGNIQRNRPNLVCPYCNNVIEDILSKNLNCKTCSKKYIKFKLNKDESLLITTEEKEKIIDIQNETIQVPIPENLFECLVIDPRVQTKINQYYEKTT